MVSETSESKNIVLYLDLLIDISNGDLIRSIFDKSDAFDFHIVNFPDLPGNIPTAPSYGTYISQMTRYTVGLAIVMTTFLLYIPCLQKDFSPKDFLRENSIELERTFYKFMGRARTCIKAQQESIINDM